MFPELTPLELASGEVFGRVETDALPPLDGRPDPRRALEVVIGRALERPPCGVAFSGGRDSSLILAVAVQVARRHGLPLPVPLTLRFRDGEDSREDEWQELVIRHLDLDSWEVIELGDELDLVGPLGLATLQRFGPSGHPQLHFDLPLLERLRGGSLLSGEYGDDVFDGRRLALAVDAARRFRRRPRPRHLATAAWAVTPTPIRARAMPRRAVRSWAGSYPWLTAGAEAEVIEIVSREYGTEPATWPRWVDWVRVQRNLSFDCPHQRALADDHDVALVDPFFEPGFLAHLRRAKRGVGWLSRTAAFTSLAADVLPPAVLARETKASFQDAFVRQPTRRLVAEWDGSSFDTDLIDVEGLREVWATDPIDARTYGLIRSLWLANHGQAG